MDVSSISGRSQPVSLTHFLRDEAGAAAVEYGLLTGFIAVAVLGTLSTLGPALEAVFTILAGAFQ